MFDLWVFHFTTLYSLCRNHTICDGFDLIQEVPLSPSTQGVWVYWHGVDTWTVSFSTPIFLAPQPQAGGLIEQVPLPVRTQGASGRSAGSSETFCGDLGFWRIWAHLHNRDPVDRVWKSRHCNSRNGTCFSPFRMDVTVCIEQITT